MITITRTITESEGSRVRDARSSTGWAKHVRSEDVTDDDVIIERSPNPAGRVYYVRVEAVAPVGPVPVDAPERPRGGTINTEVTGITPMTIDLTAAEVESLVRMKAAAFYSGLFLASGGSEQGVVDPSRGVLEAVDAYREALRFGVDLFTQSNIWADQTIDPTVVDNIRRLVKR